MKKSIILVSVFIVGLVIFSTACSPNSEQAPSSKYESFNDVAENYVFALIEEDYYTMKQYLPDDEIQGDFRIESSTKVDSPQATDVLEKMGDRYSIKGFDYFYDTHQEIYYSIQYYNYQTEHDKKPLIIGVKQEEGNFLVINKYGHGEIWGSHLDEVQGEFTAKGIISIMEKYPENTFVVKEYPDKS